MCGFIDVIDSKCKKASAGIKMFGSFEETPEIVNSIWAYAVSAFRIIGYKLYLPEAVRKD